MAGKIIHQSANDDVLERPTRFADHRETFGQGRQRTTSLMWAKHSEKEICPALNQYAIRATSQQRPRVKLTS